jgi:hypothetical protein
MCRLSERCEKKTIIFGFSVENLISQAFLVSSSVTTNKFLNRFLYQSFFDEIREMFGDVFGLEPMF